MGPGIYFWATSCGARVISLLSGQNRSMHTEMWLLRHQQDTANGQLLVWRIDKESAAAIKAADNQLIFGLVA